MAIITWSEMMSVGVPPLDADHKTLVGLINHLHQSIGDEEEFAVVGSVIGALEDYAASHFAREERMMEAAGCPQIANHHRGHQAFIDRVAVLKSRYEEDRTNVRARDCLSFLNDWLVNHICTTDMSYRPWLVGHAGALEAAERFNLSERRGGLSGGSDMAALSVLVVDDNVNFCEVLRTILEAAGISDISFAHGLDAAKNALAERSLGLVICDWHVGQENGLDLVKWLRQGPSRMAGLPVLMLSGHERMVNRDLALLAGADEFMEKPISARSLLICLTRLVRDKR
jgi:hemerythrin-like metal-binding protein